jgi:hypothetical protein
VPHTTFPEHLTAAERARLRKLWQMSAEQRVAAMRRGELTREQLAPWSTRLFQAGPADQRRVRVDRRLDAGGVCE